MPFLLICSLLGSVDPPHPSTSSSSFFSFFFFRVSLCLCNPFALATSAIYFHKLLFALSHPRTCRYPCQAAAMNRRGGVATVTDARPWTPAVAGGASPVNNNLTHTSVRSEGRKQLAGLAEVSFPFQRVEAKTLFDVARILY